VTLVLDAGALIAYERGSRIVQAHLERTWRAGEVSRTSTGVVAQVWRDGARQARVALLLRGVDEVELTGARARRVGRLLHAAEATDVVDASIVELCHDGDEVLTSDPDDIGRLAGAASKTLIVTRVS
jgi:hypothetical protein